MSEPEVLQWQNFASLFARAHKQGEHASVVGPTGSGKSVLCLSLCEIVGSRTTREGRPASVTVLGTKPRDDTLSALIAKGDFKVVKKWPPAYGQEHAVIWPRPSGDPDTIAKKQRAVFRPVLGAIYHEGGQTVCIDEAAKFERALPNGYGLEATMEEYWSAARSSKLTLIAGTQRPRHVTRSMWSEPSWVFIFEPEDFDDLKRVAELSGVREQVLEIVPHLGGHEFLCVRRQRTGKRVKRLYVSKVE